MLIFRKHRNRLTREQETAIMLSQAGFNLIGAQQYSRAWRFWPESLQFYRLDGDVRSRLTEALQPQDDPRIAALQQQMQMLQTCIQSGEVDKTKSETAKNMAMAAKAAKDAEISAAEVPKVYSETVKNLEQAKKMAGEIAMPSPATNQQGVIMSLQEQIEKLKEEIQQAESQEETEQDTVESAAEEAPEPEKEPELEPEVEEKASRRA